MEAEKFRQAEIIKEQIAILDSILKPIPDGGIINLQLQDHYGNKGGIVRNYAFNNAESLALGYIDPDRLLNKYFTEYKKAIENRKLELQEQFDKL